MAHEYVLNQIAKIPTYAARGSIFEVLILVDKEKAAARRVEHTSVFTREGSLA